MSPPGARKEGSLEDLAVGDGDCEGVRAYCPRVADEVRLDHTPNAGSYTEGKGVVGNEIVVAVEALPGKRDGFLRSKRDSPRGRAEASHSVDWGGCEELGEVFRGAVVRSHGGWWDMELGVGGKSE